MTSEESERAKRRYEAARNAALARPLPGSDQGIRERLAMLRVVQSQPDPGPSPREICRMLGGFIGLCLVVMLAGSVVVWLVRLGDDVRETRRASERTMARCAR